MKKRNILLIIFIIFLSPNILLAHSPSAWEPISVILIIISCITVAILKLYFISKRLDLSKLQIIYPILIIALLELLFFPTINVLCNYGKSGWTFDYLNSWLTFNLYGLLFFLIIDFFLNLLLLLYIQKKINTGMKKVFLSIIFSAVFVFGIIVYGIIIGLPLYIFVFGG